MAVKPFIYFEDISFNYDYDLSTLLDEILTKTEPIKLDSEYLNDYIGTDDIEEKDVKNYKGHPVFNDLKDDMWNFATEICNEIKKIPGVENATVKRSKSVGLSTYISVSFTQPNKNDPKLAPYLKDDKKLITHYLGGYGDGEGYQGEYFTKIRLSNHDVKKATNAEFILDIHNEKFDQFKNEVLSICKKRVRQLQSYFNDFLKNRKITDKQKERNAKRRARLDAYNEIINVIYRGLSKSLKESFGGERLQATLEIKAQNVLDYLKYTNTKIEDIISAIESEFADVRIAYSRLIRVCAECLVENIIEYTFEDSFDYELLFDDMRQKM